MTPTPDAMKLEDVNTVLEDMRVKGWPGVYVLGCLDRRVTVYSQQVRALNLAAALFADGKVEKDEDVVVVGAGAAGLTCAAGLQHLGAKVTVLEKEDEILSIFRGASQRWLHPGVYDWPMEGWSRDRAGLPLLDWKQNVVAEVRKQLTDAWKAIEALGNVEVVPSARNVKLSKAEDHPRMVTWNPRGKSKETRTVVLAVGFGIERYGSYWNADDIEPTHSSTPRTWLVSGCGDGALTDLLRLCIKGFRHDKMLAKFTQNPGMRGIIEKIRTIESDPKIVNDAKALHDAYVALDAPWVSDAMERRTNTVVTLNAPAHFLTRGASALNRFLVAQLYRAERFDLLPGELAEPEHEGEWRTVARFEDGPQDFDHILRRHGPKPTALQDGFKSLDDALAKERKDRADRPTLRDQTRVRRWPQGLFGHETRDDERARYLAELERRHGFIQLAGFETRVRVPVRLDDLYVPLHAVVKAAGGERDRKPGKNEKAELSVHEPRKIELALAFAEAAAANQRGVLVLGAPGSGKTTHVQQVLLKVARDGSASIGLPPSMLPVLLPLRRLEKRHTSLQAFVEDQLDTGGFDTGDGFGARTWEDGKLLLLLDGLDEVADADERRKVVGWIRQACEARAEDRFVVTCRFAGYPAEAQLGERFLELELPSMNDEQVERFVYQWYTAVEGAAHGDLSLATTRATELLTALKANSSNASFYAMATKPLLLSLMCLTHRERGELSRERGEPSLKRVQLYEEAVAVLLQQSHRVFKELMGTFSAREARLVLQPVAEQMHRHQESQSALDPERRYTPIAAVEPLLDERLALIERTDLTSREFVRAIRDESGLLTGAGVEELAFMHLGFQEYLTARSLRARAFDEPEVLAELVGRFDDPWWREVILLLLADGDPPMFRRFMSEVVKHPELPKWVETEMMDRCWNEAFAPTAEPFVRLLEQPGAEDAGLQRRQEAAATLLERLKVSRPRLVAGLSWASMPTPTHGAEIPAFETKTVAGLELVLVLVPAGSFVMGSDNDALPRERPAHRVELKPFWLARTAVTNEQYAEFLKANPDMVKPQYWGDDRYNQPRQPVVGVSWMDAHAYCQWAGLVLPTEAQWEYACGAGKPTRYWSGNGEEDLAGVSWYARNSGGRPHAVGELAANAFGLYDMHGNVYEWCEDTWVDSYEGAVHRPGDGLRTLPNPSTDRAVRGGYFASDARGLRTVFRARSPAETRWEHVGFRPAQRHP